MLATGACACFAEVFILIGLQEGVLASVVNAGLTDTLLGGNGIFRKNRVDCK